MGMRTREEVPQRSRPRYVVTRLDETQTYGQNGAQRRMTVTTFYVVDLQDKARCVWRVTGGYPKGTVTQRARQRAEQIARQMNSSYERGLRAAEVA